MVCNSRLYTGSVRHSRCSPVKNTFNYKIFMLYIDLGELDQIFENYVFWSIKPNLAWFRRADHIGNQQSDLGSCVRDLVMEKTGRRPSGPIRLLTNLRYFFFRSNPVSFYYVFGSDEITLEAVVAEVTNTPWDEQHCYVLDFQESYADRQYNHFTHDKRFHVSPFLPMNMTYEWRISSPGDKLTIYIQNFREGEKTLDVTLDMNAQQITSRSLLRCLLLYPFITVKVTLAIYWQALKLWTKRVPFFSHPKRSKSTWTPSDD